MCGLSNPVLVLLLPLLVGHTLSQLYASAIGRMAVDMFDRSA
jgi:hypothetical protein